jgi:hypothetical protein
MNCGDPLVILILVRQHVRQTFQQQVDHKPAYHHHFHHLQQHMHAQSFCPSESEGRGLTPLHTISQPQAQYILQ